MKCPHYRVAFYDEPKPIYIGKDSDGDWIPVQSDCPVCKKIILKLLNGFGVYNKLTQEINFNYVKRVLFIRPKSSSRPHCPSEVFRVINRDRHLLLIKCKKSGDPCNSSIIR